MLLLLICNKLHTLFPSGCSPEKVNVCPGCSCYAAGSRGPSLILCIPVPPPRRGIRNRTHSSGSFHTKGASSGGGGLASAGHTVAVFRVWGHPHSRACFVVTIMLSGRTRRLSSVDSQMSSPLSIASILLIPGSVLPLYLCPNSTVGAVVPASRLDFMLGSGCLPFSGAPDRRIVSSSLAGSPAVTHTSAHPRTHMALGGSFGECCDKMRGPNPVFSPSSPGVFHLPFPLSPEFRGMSVLLPGNTEVVFHF